MTFRLAFYTLFACSMLVGCTADAPDMELQKPKPRFDFEHWHKLTILNGDTVLYHPCKTSNAEIIFAEHADAVVMTEVGDSAVYRFKITNVSKDKQKETYSGVNIDSKSNVSFERIVQPDLSLCFWKKDSETTNMGLFVRNSKKHLYKTITQPCKECFPETECE